MLEEWAWDADVLRTFATDADGEPIPRELVAKMRAAKEFGKGTYVAHADVLRGAVLHAPPGRARRHHRDVRELQEQYDVFGYVPDTHFHASFGHLDGYGSGYYTYMWSLVIAKDLFSAFDRDDLFATDGRAPLPRPGAGPRRRKDAADLVEDFLGRPYGFEAFQRWLDRV